MTIKVVQRERGRDATCASLACLLFPLCSVLALNHHQQTRQPLEPQTTATSTNATASCLPSAWIPFLGLRFAPSLNTKMHDTVIRTFTTYRYPKQEVLQCFRPTDFSVISMCECSILSYSFLFLLFRPISAHVVSRPRMTKCSRKVTTPRIVFRTCFFLCNFIASTTDHLT